MIADEEFLRGKIPMTKQEIRILTLAKAQIKIDSIVADIGAGTGSISIEAARLARNGKIFAIERKAEAFELIKRNVEKFSVDNVEIIQAEAPEGLEDLPELDAAIIGGSGGHLEKIFDVLGMKLKIGGRVVVNAITLQTAAAALEYFKRHAWKCEAFQVQINRLERVGSYDMMRALNPVWIITAEAAVSC
ncbi:MAG: precorrin-6Y C5,15-methyltransferase (decarboxylating) subunit CbiT [Selenomonadaceae bacterium]|nr:precorrin-6Y C5,15-methyltransferase (decarboxylating) subunit CbiT [Selenomonadaceae bacterium]